ncbi:MAG: nucleotidyltransferase [Anaerolineae bacterium]|nr:nucleotidyltransferase [Anaerolineae bacterium]
MNDMAQLFRSIQALQQRLNEAGIPSVVIGGVAVGTWGDPRVTRDVDLKVLLGREDADRLLALLVSDYRSLLPDPRTALQKQAMLFVEDAAGVRLDLLLADTPYDVEAIRRGRDVEAVPGVIIRVCAPEDLIIYKMISTRPRDHEDARSVIRRQGDALDDRYVLNWLRQFELALDDSTLVRQYRQWRKQATG